MNLVRDALHFQRVFFFFFFALKIYHSPEALEVWSFNTPKISKIKILDSHFKEMARCGAIPCLVSCLLQRMLHGNVKVFDGNFKKMGEESTWAVELVLEDHSLFIFWSETQF